MNIKLLCVDVLEDYSLIDDEYLNGLGIDLSILYTSKNSESKKNGIKIDKFNFEEIFRVSKSIMPDRIVCYSEELFSDVAKVRQCLNIKGMDVDTARLFSNKYLMYIKLKDKVDTPKSLLLSKDISYKEIKGRVESEQIFIKPVSCSGSYETYHILSEKCFSNFLLKKKLPISSYIAQTFIHGELYHSELIVENGKIRFRSARKYSAPNHSMICSGELLYSVFVDDIEIEKALLKESIVVQQGLNVNSAVMHTEFFLENSTGNLVFLETNLRAPGIGLNNMYNKILGISYETIMCLLVCEKAIPFFNECEKVYACGYYPLQEGTVKKINKIDVKINSDWTYFIKEGEHNNQRRSMTKAAMVICSDLKKNKVIEAMKLLHEHQLIEVY